MDLERKFCATEGDLTLRGDDRIEGYASLFGACDQGGDIVEPGAYGECLSALASKGGRIKMLWQHDPTQPIGIWDEVREDGTGLYVKGRILTDVAKGREAAALIAAGAIDGLSIGYRTRKATKDGQGRRRLSELELWEVSLVTFPMLAEARVTGAKSEPPEIDPIQQMARMFRSAARSLAEGAHSSTTAPQKGNSDDPA